MLSKNESSIINFIRYSPILLISMLSIIIIYIMYQDKNEKYTKQINNLKKDFIFENKKAIQKEVDSVYDYILYEKNSSENQLKVNIKNRLDEVHKIITFIYEKYKDIEPERKL